MTVERIKRKLQWMLSSGSTDGRSYRALIKSLIEDIEEDEKKNGKEIEESDLAPSDG
jgi:hypothetical protein